MAVQRLRHRAHTCVNLQPPTDLKYPVVRGGESQGCRGPGRRSGAGAARVSHKAHEVQGGILDGRQLDLQERAGRTSSLGEDEPA